ncbi:MAG: thermonuclease family protein [Candidatus Shapirobacteria bacterium]|nr:thermonuclease family protein [Candidatus Shapirobacteria bacterium]
MKKILTFIGLFILVIVFVLGVIRLLSGPEDNWICQKGEWVKHGHPIAPKPTGICGKITPSLTLTSSPAEKLYKVTRVIDGDTIEIEGGQKVRYIGIDTAEINDKNPVKLCLAKKAMEKNKELVEGKEIRLEKDVSETDKYKRLLRYVYVDNLFVNDYLVRNGFANAVTYPPDVKFKEQFQKDQQEARTNNLGLWNPTTCPK